jgi:uncharacterized membrane protein (DUF4010 family)
VLDLTDPVLATRLGVATLAGLAVGVEREWSRARAGAGAGEAGVRTFALYGLVGGIAGLPLSGPATLVAWALLLGAAALVVATYVASERASAARPVEAPRRHDPGGTTEVAALVVLGLGALAGTGRLAIAAGAAALVALALGEKQRLHWLVGRIGERDLRAGLQFAVFALVVLPLLPTGPFGPGDAIRPRTLWATVLVFLAVDFAGHVARRAVGPARGFGVAGLLGGLVSSTAVTLGHARRSRAEPAHADALAIGVIGACTVLLPRIVVVTLVLQPAVARALLPYLLPPFVVGAVVAIVALRRTPRGTAPDAAEDGSPLRLGTALTMALAFQVALVVLPLAERHLGATGVLGSAALLGLTDMDALTVSMSRLAAREALVPLAARAIAVGVLANTALKLALALALGTRRFRLVVALGLGGLGVASGIGLLLGGR